MNRDIFLVAHDHKTLVSIINGFFDDPELKKYVDNAVEAYMHGNWEPNENVDVYNVEALFDFYMCICGFGSIVDGIVDDELDDLFGTKTPRTDKIKQERIAAELRSEGFITHTLGNNILAFSTEKKLDNDNRYYLMWHLVKYISNGRCIEAWIVDYYSDLD